MQVLFGLNPYKSMKVCPKDFLNPIREKCKMFIPLERILKPLERILKPRMVFK